MASDFVLGCFVLGCFIAGFFFIQGLCYSIKLANSRAPALLGSQTQPLPDLLHTALPQCPVWVPDVSLALLAAYVLLNADARTRVLEDKPLGTLLVAFAVRALTIHLTVLPTPVPRGAYCYGHDLWVSGHTLVFAALAPASATAAALGACTLIMARQHYSIDVLGAALLYHAAKSLVAM